MFSMGWADKGFQVPLGHGRREGRGESGISQSIDMFLILIKIKERGKHTLAAKVTGA